jgi:hypothetical protein
MAPFERLIQNKRQEHIKTGLDSGLMKAIG